MMSNDGDDEGCRSSDNAIDDAVLVDVFDNGVGVRKMMMFFVCACLIACHEK